MKKRLALLLCVAMLISCFSMFSCDEEPTEETCVVTFNPNGGSAVDSKTVAKGEKVSAPADPQREGYSFDGWYFGDEKWSFVGYTVTEDMILTAKWIQNNGSTSGGGTSGGGTSGGGTSGGGTSGGGTSGGGTSGGGTSGGGTSGGGTSGGGTIQPLPDEELSPAFSGTTLKFSGNYTVLTQVDRSKGRAFNVVDLVEADNLGDTTIIKAVRERNEKIKSNFGITVKRRQEADLENYAKNQIQAQEATFDAFRIPVRSALSIACSGGLLDLNEDTQYLDLSNKW
ncbi:MAG: InlB B-repeat-containing protein, partial [Clostridia bacterium]|nr:InlB B-repeat-containing protein [Clostridia bacterium]